MCIDGGKYLVRKDSIVCLYTHDDTYLIGYSDGLIEVSAEQYTIVQNILINDNK